MTAPQTLGQDPSYPKTNLTIYLKFVQFWCCALGKGMLSLRAVRKTEQKNPDRAKNNSFSHIKRILHRLTWDAQITYRCSVVYCGYCFSFAAGMAREPHETPISTKQFAVGRSAMRAVAYAENVRVGEKFRHNRVTSQINFRTTIVGGSGGKPRGKFCKIPPKNTQITPKNTHLHLKIRILFIHFFIFRV